MEKNPDDNIVPFRRPKPEQETVSQPPSELPKLRRQHEDYRIPLHHLVDWVESQLPEESSSDEE